MINKFFGNRLRLMRIRMKYDKRTLLALEDFIKCEAHRELFLKGLEQRNE